MAMHQLLPTTHTCLPLMKLTFFVLVCSSLLGAFVSDAQSSPARKAAVRTPLPKRAVVAKAAAKPPFFHPLITTEALAIAVAEPILFSIYGPENIKQQRPYRVHLVDGCWQLSGTLPEATVGGTFYIVIEASNCRVLTLFHTK